MEALCVRKSVPSDREFILQGIMSAEKSGSGPIPWCGLFDLTEAEFSDLLLEILEEELEGQEWCAGQFWLATLDERVMGGLSVWIEQACRQSSAMLRSALVYHFISEAKREEADEKLKRIHQLGLSRTPGYLQLESIFVLDPYKGKGIAANMIQAVLSYFNREHPELPGAEIMLSGENAAAIRAYQRAGFVLVSEVVYPGPEQEIREVFPGRSKVLFRKDF
jgi:GNAT superfamily N-acetyltransferase